LDMLCKVQLQIESGSLGNISECFS